MIDIPAELAATQERHNGAAGRAFIAALPTLATDFLTRWELRLNGPSMYGVCALVLPVVRPDGTPAVLKLQPPDTETEGEPAALRAWNGNGAVRLLDHDPPTGTLLLERLDQTRTLARAPDAQAAAVTIARLLTHLTTTPPPPRLRHLGDITEAMLKRTPAALAHAPSPDRRLLTDCAAAVREVADEPGNRLLHWDLHYGNVLAADRGATPSWIAIDPKPLTGDPGFELFPALANRFDPDEIRRRFDAMTDVLALDRPRARAWTLARVLQASLWNLATGHPPTPAHLEIARTLRAN